jgi:hypothetical protein
MQYKASLLLAALAGSAVARPHAHERRHAHAKAEAEVAVEERGVGDEVYATIDNVLVSWINNWAGEATTTTSTTTTPTPVVVPTTTAEPTTTAQPAPTSGSGSGSGSSSGSSSSGGNWFDTITLSDGTFSRQGFGKKTTNGDSGSGKDWSYIGNVGSPWGSNIIEVDANSASSYKHVLRMEGSKTSDWTVVFWNTYGPNNKMDGFWSPNAALTLNFAPGEIKYVAIDDDSQGAFTAGPGSSAPISPDGQYGGTWGEFDMSSGKNAGHSGWDVSCIIAELANLFVHGMRICDHNDDNCSSMGAGITDIVKAYTSADQGNPALAIQQNPGPVRLVVQLDY